MKKKSARDCEAIATHWPLQWPGQLARCARGRGQTFTKMPPLSGCQLDSIQDENLCSCAKGELAHRCIDDVVAALYRAIKAQGGFDGGAEGSGVGCTVLGMWMEGDLEVVQCILEQFWRGKSGDMGVWEKVVLCGPEDVEAIR